MNILEISQVFFNLTAGASALAGINIYRGKSSRLTYIKRYPVNKLNSTFKLVDTKKAPGKVYLIDLKAKTRQWIMSSRTLIDLGFYWDQVQRIPQKEFDSYQEKRGILTAGFPGT